MFHSARVGLLGSALAALLVAATGSAADADPKFLPDDTEVVVFVDVKQVLGSELAKTHAKLIDQFKGQVRDAIKGNPAVATLFDKAGFDPFKDLTSVTLAMPPAVDVVPTVILHGTFDRAKIAAVMADAAKAAPDKVKVAKVGKADVYEVVGDDKKAFHAGLVADGVLVIAGSADGVKVALDRAAGTAKPALKKELAALLDPAGKASVAFHVTSDGITKLAANTPGVNPQATAAFKQFDGASLTAAVGKDVDARMSLTVKDEATAKQMALQAGLGLGVAKGMLATQAQKNPQLAPLMTALDTLKTGSDKNAFTLTGKLSAEVIGKLLEGAK